MKISIQKKKRRLKNFFLNHKKQKKKTNQPSVRVKGKSKNKIK